MRISDLLNPNAVFPSVAARGKDEAISTVAAHLSSCYRDIDRDGLTTALAKRERLMSTALADGVAIPHARLGGLSRTVAALGRSHSGIDWDAQDGRPTHLFFVLVVPDDAQSAHLKLLAAVSRLLHDPGCRTRLMSAADELLLATLRSEEDRVVVSAMRSPSATLARV
jgi:PTS system nitrogen regulatory IIA component